MNEKDAQPPHTSHRRSWLAWISTGVIVCAVGLILIRTGVLEVGGARSIDGAPLIPVVPEPGMEQSPSSPQLRASGDLDGVLPAGPGDVIHVEVAQIAALEIVKLELLLPVAATSGARRPVRVYAANRAPLELESAPMTGERSRVRIDLPASAILLPGKYIVEVETDERSTFPLRRFAIEVH